jgi:hypothetical protein
MCEQCEMACFCQVNHLRRMTHWWRIVKLSMILNLLPQGSNPIFEFATIINMGESRNSVIINMTGHQSEQIIVCQK